MYRSESPLNEQFSTSVKPRPDIAVYLNFIGVSKKNDPTLSYLRKLQRNHLLSVPFENLDIQYFKKIELSVESFFKKIICHKRGGYCYELNGLFYWLLKKEGFEVEMISARVFDSKGKIGPAFDHLALLVTLAGKKHLVDVGFGDFSARPLYIKTEVEQVDDNGVFMIREFEGADFIVLKKQGTVWKHQYIFSTQPHQLEEFQAMNHFHQTSPLSQFTQRKVCSIMTKNGRITLTNKRLIISEHGTKKQHSFHTENEFNKILETNFGFRMD